MKTLNKGATRTFLKLIAGLAPGQGKHLDSSNGPFMAVSVDFLSEHAGARLYAVAHRYEQNGDLVPDPDVEFYVTQVGENTYVVPTAIDHGPLGYYRYVRLENGRPASFSPRGQAGLATFCNTWMSNIRHQQGL